MDHLVGPSAPAAPAIARPADHPAARSGRVGVLLLNLGTPDATDYWSMRRYLKEFLSDRRVIETPRLIWWPILNLIILTKRPGPKGQDYAKIWNKERDEGPLKTITRAQAESLARHLSGSAGDRVVVDWAMRYGNPAVAGRIQALLARGLRPHPPRAALSAIFGGDLGDRLRPGLPGPDGHALAAGDPRLAALSRRSGLHRRAGIGDEARTSPRLDFEPEVILVSFHGVPKAYLLKGDPYHCHCVKTWRLMREAFGWPEERFRLSFQSRFGNDGMAAALHRRDRDGAGARAASSASPSSRRASPPIASRRWRSSTARTAHYLRGERRREVRLSALPQRQRGGHARHPAHRRARAGGLDLRSPPREEVRGTIQGSALL